MIKHKAWQEPKSSSDGVRILAMAHYPRGARKDICDVSMPELAPDPDVLKAFHDGEMSWPTFISRYKAKLKQPTQKHLMQLLAALSRNFGQDVTVMCGCRDAARCHRTVLVEVIDASYRELS